MTIKATVIGGSDRKKLEPTTLGQLPASAAAAPPARKPTSLPAGVPIPPPPAVVIRTTQLPGTVRAPVTASLAALTARFPSLTQAELARVKAVLSEVVPDAWNTHSWLDFGIEAQEALGAVIQERLQLLAGDALRVIPRHLARLQPLLLAVLEALPGGWLKRSVHQVWREYEPEIRQLESMLALGGETLRKLLPDLAAITRRSLDCQDDLMAHMLAADYLGDQLPVAAGELLLSRQTSLATSQAMLQEHILALRQDEARMQALIVLVQDGVLIKLPAIYMQLASLPERPNDTQRFLVVENLNEVLQFFER